jgi:Mrp family chromosome partitioning ATPase
MEQIKKAVERAKASAGEDHLRPTTALHGQIEPPATATSQSSTQKFEPTVLQAGSAQRYNDVRLDGSHLEHHRIVGHNVADPRSKAFDVLRTQVLQAMDQKNWQFLAVTSPTEGCGKTVTAINLALSIARQPHRSALLIDIDLQRPAVADYLGIKCRLGTQSILEGRGTLADATIRANADGCELLVLPTEAPTMRSSELIGSRNMDTMLHDIKRNFRSETVIFDMPPLLQGDEVLATLPRIDAVLLVTAVGVSTLHEIKECNRHLQATEVIRLVLNKSHETIKRHYY